MDDTCQADAPDDYAPPVNIYRKRNGGNKGDVAGQSRRYYARNRAKRRDYMRRWMASRRKLLGCSEI